MFENEVRAGVAALDSTGPSNWRARLDYTRLDMRRSDTCILGQVFTSYWSNDASWFKESHNPTRCGFWLPYHEEHHYGALTDAWRRELARVPQEA